MYSNICEQCGSVRRKFDGKILSKRTLLAVICFGVILYIGPSIFHWLVNKTTKMKVMSESTECVEAQLNKYLEGHHFDFIAMKSYDRENPKSYLPYVGNGKFGFAVSGSSVYIPHGRSLSLPLGYQPMVYVDIPRTSQEDSNATHLKHGVGYRIQCFRMEQDRNGIVSVTSHFLAHRVFPSLLLQILEITNLSDDPVTVILNRKLPDMTLHTLKMGQGKQGNFQYHRFNGHINIPESHYVIFASALSIAVPSSVSVEPRGSKTLSIRTIVHYSDPVLMTEYELVKRRIDESAKKELIQALKTSAVVLEQQHIETWEEVWQSGFSISISRAQNALNGDQINATLYYVLSSTRDYLAEENTSWHQRSSVQHFLYSPDKCYSGHHTLQASTLWSDLSYIDDVNNIVSLWLLTLNKQGCHNLISAGARGVMQAMVLSFGGFKFSNHHLEFDCDPKHLHRDYHFRRIMYGNATLINVSVIVQTDNKAVIYASLDKSNKEYYGCDGGCLDAPVSLGSVPSQFPVKITSPLTSLLYITPDKSHIEELKHAIHVKGVIEAPAHGHHIIALHRHGHQLGGLPAVFWISVAFLIAVFHLFLAKLIYNEYCGNEIKSRRRYLV